NTRQRLSDTKQPDTRSYHLSGRRTKTATPGEAIDLAHLHVLVGIRPIALEATDIQLVIRNTTKGHLPQFRAHDYKHVAQTYHAVSIHVMRRVRKISKQSNSVDKQARPERLSSRFTFGSKRSIGTPQLYENGKIVVPPYEDPEYAPVWHNGRFSTSFNSQKWNRNLPIT